MSAPRCFPGRVLNTRYRLDEIIGKGAVATVWRAFDLRTERPCAIKMLNAANSESADERRRLAREGTLVSRLCHPSLLQMYALDEDSDGTPFLVMEWIRGCTLREILRLRGRLSFEQASHVLRQIGSALACAHSMGVLHRDLKPQNIVLTAVGDENLSGCDLGQALVKVVDFGLAGDCEASRSASICAPLARDIEYRSPELQEAGSVVDARSDQWSLAVIAYELLAGVQPFHDLDPVRLALQIRDGRFTPLSLHRPDLPPYVGAAIDRALSVASRDRFASVADFVRALHGSWPRMFRVATVAEVEPTAAAPVDLQTATGERAKPALLRSPGRAAAVALLALLALAMPLSWVGGISRRPVPPQPGAGELYAGDATAPAISPTARRSPAPPEAIPPLRLADPRPASDFPPLRLAEGD